MAELKNINAITISYNRNHLKKHHENGASFLLFI